MVCYWFVSDYPPLSVRLRPPSTAKICPVIYDDLAKNSTALAISSGVPALPSGTESCNYSRIFKLKNSSSSGKIFTPGDTPLTQTKGANSKANDCTIARWEAFAMV